MRVATSDDTEPALMHMQSMLDIEQAIDARLSDHAGEIVRVMHTLTARQLHLRGGSADLILGNLPAPFEVHVASSEIAPNPTPHRR